MQKKEQNDLAANKKRKTLQNLQKKLPVTDAELIVKCRRERLQENMIRAICFRIKNRTVWQR
jgi:hypothetical protein